MVFIFLFFDVSSEVHLIVGIFALIVVTTATLQKFIWEQKYQYLNKEVSKISFQNELSLVEMKELLDEKRELRRKLKK